MKYFSPSYWLKMWVLSVPLFNDKTQGINARLLDNNIKDWTSENNTSLSTLKNQEATLSNNQPYNLSHQVTNQNIVPFYQTQLDTQPWNNNLNPVSTHKHLHEKTWNRHKRQNPKTQMRTLSTALLIAFYNYSQGYLERLEKITNELFQREIIIPTSTNLPSTSRDSNTTPPMFNPTLPLDNSDLLEMLVETQSESNDAVDNDSVRISLVFATRNLVVQGFILTQIDDGTRHYFHFDSTPGDQYAVSVPGINADNTYSLGFAGSYISSRGLQGIEGDINWSEIHGSFQYIRSLTNFNDYRSQGNTVFVRGRENDNREARTSLIRIILVASESLRTRSIRDCVTEMVNGQAISWKNKIQKEAVEWSTKSKKYDKDILILYTPKLDNPSKKDICSIPSKNNKNRGRGTRSVDDCLIVNSIAILGEDSSIGPTEAKKGTMWIATNNGVLLKYRDGDYPEKINNLDESVKFIDIDHQGSAYAIAHSGNFYYISIRGWDWIADKSRAGNKNPELITQYCLIII